MKKFMIVAATSLAITVPAYAIDEHHPEQGQSMVSTANEPLITQEKALQRMQANIEKMQTQLKLVSNAKTDEMRNKLLLEHMMIMHENMMLGMGIGCPMMRGGMGMMGGRGMRGGGTGMGQGGNMYDRMQQKEKRMDMMQKTMDQR